MHNAENIVAVGYVVNDDPDSENIKKLVDALTAHEGLAVDTVDALDPAHFTACLDLGHCGLVGDNAGAMIRQMGSRLGCLHIHDNDNFNDSHTLPYTSAMDWDDILHALGEIDYQGHFTYEADNFIRDFPEDLLPACEKFMHDVGRSMMSKIEKYRVKK